MAEPAAPAGYAEERERGARVVALPSVMVAALDAIRSAGGLHEAARAAGAGSFAGRGAAYRFDLAGIDSVVRHYRRGGWISRLLHDEYVRLNEPRPIAELRASTVARSRGVGTPEVVAAVVYPAGIFYRADIATRYITGSRDLASVVIGASCDALDARIAAWRAAGALLRRAFAAGVEHADLNLGNIVIAGGRGLLLDLDRAVVRDGAVEDASRRRMLDRLHRSRRKLERLHGTSVTTAELAALDEGLQHD